MATKFEKTYIGTIFYNHFFEGNSLALRVVQVGKKFLLEETTEEYRTKKTEFKTLDQARVAYAGRIGEIILGPDLPF